MEFNFENTLKITEAEYVAVWSVLPTWYQSGKIRLVLLLVLGAVFLFTPYTLLLGIILLGLGVVGLLAPRILEFGAHDQFRRHVYLRDALTYGVNEEKIWVKSAKIDASVPWSMLVTWSEIEGYLVLSPSGIPPVYLSLAKLSAAGLYGRVRALAASNAPEFNKFKRR